MTCLFMTFSPSETSMDELSPYISGRASAFRRSSPGSVCKDKNEQRPSKMFVAVNQTFRSLYAAIFDKMSRYTTAYTCM